MDVKAIHLAAKAWYWDEKDLASARRLLEEGIALARTQELTGEEKAMNFDLASFCWRGWDERGVTISAEDDQARVEAATENLRLAQELDRPAGPMGAAWWMVGAYRLQEGDLKGAKDAFEAFRDYTENDPIRIHLALGYIELTEQNSAPSRICAELKSMDGYGPAFADQLETAARVFAR